MTNLPALRNILYEILTAEDDTDSVKATQQMGVQLSSAVKKEGVTIVQVQSVINKKVIGKVTEGLRLIDQMDQPEVIDVEPDTMDAFMRTRISQGYDLRLFLDTISALYVVTAVDMLGQDQARKRLGIRQATIDKAMRPLDG